MYGLYGDCGGPYSEFPCGILTNSCSESMLLSSPPYRSQFCLQPVLVAKTITLNTTLVSERRTCKEISGPGGLIPKGGVVAQKHGPASYLSVASGARASQASSRNLKPLNRPFLDPFQFGVISYMRTGNMGRILRVQVDPMAFPWRRQLILGRSHRGNHRLRLEVKLHNLQSWVPLLPPSILSC